MYSYKMHEGGKECKKAKGIKKNVKKQICFEDYQKCLFTKNSIYKKQNLFRTRCHNIFTVEQNKQALSAYDDKRHILENDMNTLGLGHYQIEVEKDQFINYLKGLNKLQMLAKR